MKISRWESEPQAEIETSHLDYLRSAAPTIMRCMKILELDEGKSAEEIKKELMVDFSSLTPGEMPMDIKLQAKMLLNMHAGIMRGENICQIAEKLHPSDHIKYDLKKYNNGIVGLGIEKFMTAATQFCENEAAGGAIDIISVGSGDGTVERKIKAEYRQRFNKDICIKLVDHDPKFTGIVDYKTVDHLVEENPNVVSNCVLLIIWPNPVGNLLEKKKDDNYDIDAVRKLQPNAALTVYENTGGSGSNEFRIFLHDDSLDDISPENYGSQNWSSQLFFKKEKSYGLDNYSIEEVIRQRIVLGQRGTYTLRLVKLKKDW